MSKQLEDYKTLEKVFTSLSHLDQTSGILHWDMSVMMPENGAAARADQLATLGTISQAILTDNDIGELIENSKKIKRLSNWQKSNVK
jgi:carboxypeptidase Taq